MNNTQQEKNSKETRTKTTEVKSELDPLQILFNRMKFIEHASYSPNNLAGRPNLYPAYGDSPDTFMLRTYGKWWKESESAQPNYKPQDIDEIESEDFVTVKFQKPVIPTSIMIYETYNPGAVVRLYGRHKTHLTPKYCLEPPWLLLYEAAPTKPKPKPGARCFSPPLKRIASEINEVRIELNQSLLENSTGLDAVLLAGYQAQSVLQTFSVSEILGTNYGNKSTNRRRDRLTDIPDKAINYFDMLPYETILHIFQHLDLMSLLQCALVCKKFYQVTLDPMVYQAISLRKYWMKITDNALVFFQQRCSMLKKLDLSWCGNGAITPKGFQDFMAHSSQQLTHLSLGNCDFIENRQLTRITLCNQLVDLRLRYVESESFEVLGSLNKLQTLDVCGTNIERDPLIEIVCSNPQLKHLIIDHCSQLRSVDTLFHALSTFNLELRTLSCWKVPSVTARGVQFLQNCRKLCELDLGWVLVNAETSNCLEPIAKNCDLQRLIISSWRNMGDHELLPIITYCTNLKQLDLLGIRNLSPEMMSFALAMLKQLELLDVSYCQRFTIHEIRALREDYPNVTILWSTSGDIDAH